MRFAIAYLSVSLKFLISFIILTNLSEPSARICKQYVRLPDTPKISKFTDIKGWIPVSINKKLLSHNCLLMRPSKRKQFLAHIRFQIFVDTKKDRAKQNVAPIISDIMIPNPFDLPFHSISFIRNTFTLKIVLLPFCPVLNDSSRDNACFAQVTSISDTSSPTHHKLLISGPVIKIPTHLLTPYLSSQPHEL